MTSEQDRFLRANGLGDYDDEGVEEEQVGYEDEGGDDEVISSGDEEEVNNSTYFSGGEGYGGFSDEDIT